MPRTNRTTRRTSSARCAASTSSTTSRSCRSRSAAQQPRGACAPRTARRTQTTTSRARSRTATGSQPVTYAHLQKVLGPQLRPSELRCDGKRPCRVSWRRADTRKRFLELVATGAKVFIADRTKIARLCSQPAQRSAAVARALRQRFGPGIKAVTSDRQGNWIVAAKL